MAHRKSHSLGRTQDVCEEHVCDGVFKQCLRRQYVDVETISDGSTELVVGALGALSSVPFDVAPRKTGKGWFASHIPRPFGGRSDVRSLWATSIGTALPAEKQTRLLEFIARLRQPFGALLLTSAGYDVEEYRRVAAESLITVQLGEITSPVLEGLIRGVQMLDVL